MKGSLVAEGGIRLKACGDQTLRRQLTAAEKVAKKTIRWERNDLLTDCWIGLAGREKGLPQLM